MLGVAGWDPVWEEWRTRREENLQHGWMALTDERTTPIIISESGRDTNWPQRFAESDKLLLSYTSISGLR